MERKAAAKGKVAIEAFETIKASFLDDVYATVVMEDIQDHTGLHYVLVSSWTMEKKSSTCTSCRH